MAKLFGQLKNSLYFCTVENEKLRPRLMVLSSSG